MNLFDKAIVPCKVELVCAQAKMSFFCSSFVLSRFIAKRGRKSKNTVNISEHFEEF